MTACFCRADWDLGRPPRRGAGAIREHFHRYTRLHCMMFPNRSPAQVVDRLKLMFRYNAMKVLCPLKPRSMIAISRTRLGVLLSGVYCTRWIYVLSYMHCLWRGSVGG